MALYFLFDDMRYNLLLYFSILTIILELFGHEKIMPSLKKINAAPVVQTPAGDIGGILMATKYGRNIHAYKGEVSGKVLVNSLRSLVAHRFGHVEFEQTTQVKKPSEIKLPLKFSKIKLDTNSINWG